MYIIYAYIIYTYICIYTYVDYSAGSEHFVCCLSLITTYIHMYVCVYYIYIYIYTCAYIYIWCIYVNEYINFLTYFEESL